MWGSTGRSGYGDTNLDGTYDDVILGVSPNGRQYRNKATLETRNLSGAAYWSMRKQSTPEQEIPEALYARNDTVNLAHTLPNGKANLLAYADRPTPVKSKVSIKDKILPQLKRLNTLRSQMIELEREYKDKSKGMSIEEYSLLRDVLVAKIQRQEVLYKRAASIKPTRPETDEDSAEYTYSSLSNASDDEVHGEDVVEPVGVEWINELSDTNSLKNILKKACVVCRTLVIWHNRTKAYVQTLKEEQQ